MKYEAGDEVWVRGDLKAGTMYGGANVSTEMEDYAGERVTISRKLKSLNCYDILGNASLWADEMFAGKVMKFKVGDRVRVRNDLINGERYGTQYVIDEISKFKGQIVTITSAGVWCGTLFYPEYKIKEDDNYVWTDEMFESEEGWANSPHVEVNNIPEVDTKMIEKPKTGMEKKALKEAKKEAIEAVVALKKSEYQQEMTSFIDYEKSARKYRKTADEKAELLGLTKEEINALF